MEWQIDPINFVTRLRIPILTLNGQFDFTCPLHRARAVVRPAVGRATYTAGIGATLVGAPRRGSPVGLFTRVLQ